MMDLLDTLSNINLSASGLYCDLNVTNLTSPADNTSNSDLCRIASGEIISKPAVFRIGATVFAYFTPLIFVVGIVGNGLSLSVFRSTKLSKLSASKYLAALSLADISSLIFYVLVEWLRRGLEHIVPDIELAFLHKNGFCQVILYMSYISRLMSSWIIVVFTIERFTCVCYPLRSFKRGARKILLSMFALSCLLVLYKPILSGEYSKSGVTVCTANPEFKLVSFALDGTFAIAITLIPFIIITVLNILIVRKLFLRNRESRDLFSDDSTIRLEFTLILLAISFFFVAFNLPFSVVWARNHLYFNVNQSRSNKTVDVDYWIGIQLITRTVFYMNYCINFFLYSITGKYFRTALFEMITCKGSSRNRYGSYIKCRRLGSSNTHVTVCDKRSGSMKSHSEAQM
ncbi:C-C chemokine receptor type 7-like [Mercenaria mercenaria]|uniref:C-C chemokine receptor type 7-like n=1 Tax=Mercenaria mercenaria TaxID=6596 RepID=UPI00234F40B7|nr:C-C chemokine receptor type 7-like [Mercenaria mercenaria]